MGVIRIEPEPPTKEARCGTCGGTNRLMHGYVYDDDHPHGLYFLEWCDGAHPQRAAWLTIGLGEFAENAPAADRRSVCIEWRAEGMRLTDTPARDNPDLLGLFLPREQTLNTPHTDDVWHVADHIVLDDPRAADIERWLKE